MNTCDENLSQLHMLVEQEIEPGAAEVLNEHLSSCPKCSAEFKELQQTKGLIEESLAARVAVPDVYEAVLQRISEPAKPVRRRYPFLRWAGLSLAAASATVVLAAVAFLYHLGFIGPKPVAARLAYVSTAGGEWKRAGEKIRGLTVVSSKVGERVALRLESGVQIILNEKTAVNVQSVNQLNLLKGNIYINTAGQEGVLLRVKTRQASTLVTGTKLGVSADPEETSVVVEEGKVSVEGNWGEQVVTHGSIFRIIQSMKPEPPEPVDLEEVFFWVKERAHLEGMIIDLYEPENEEVTPIANDKELLQKILYGLEQSRDSIMTGDVVFDMASFKYGYDLTDNEKKEYLEQMVQGHIAQLNLKQPPSEQQLWEIVQNVVNSVVQQSRTRTSGSVAHWMFELPDKVRQEIFDDKSKQFLPAMLINGHTRYWPLRGSAEFTQDNFPVKGHPAYLGRSETPVSELSNPRLIRTEEVNGVTTYLLEADLLGYETTTGQPARDTVQLWVDPDRNYLVLKRRRYEAGPEQPKMQTCLETTADSFEEVSPGVFYPQTFTETLYMGEMISGELVLRKTDETIYTQREGQFNTPLASRMFDITIPPNVPIEEFRAEWMKKAISPLVSNIFSPTNASTPEELLRGVYAELEQIKLYDDPSAPGSRKLILRLNGKKLENTLRNRGGVMVTSAVYRGEVVGVRVNSVDPAIAAEVPFMKGDVIFTLNDEPWKMRGPLDWVSGLESCIPIVNSGRPITAGVQRQGKLYYEILWFD